MKDRVVQYPNRFKLVPVAGTTDVVDLVPVPGTVTDEGTPLSKGTLLGDPVGLKYGLDSAGTVSQALLNGVDVKEINVGTAWVANGKVFTQRVTATWSKVDFTARFSAKLNNIDFEEQEENGNKILYIDYFDGYVVVTAKDTTYAPIILEIKGV